VAAICHSSYNEVNPSELPEENERKWPLKGDFAWRMSFAKVSEKNNFTDKFMKHVLMCGGSGVRLWPLSRESKPKQFISFFDETSLLQKTALGTAPLATSLTVVCSVDHYHLVAQQLKEKLIEPKEYILEPASRNTAGAVCLAAFASHPEQILFITPADHEIEYGEEFARAIEEGKSLAAKGELTVFGIRPSRPETGFGYMQIGEGRQVIKFHEKPPIETAIRYLSEKNFLWNSGMIMVKAGKLLELMKNLAPEIYLASEKTYKQGKLEKEVPWVLKVQLEDMISIPAVSVDCALLEKMEALRYVEGTFLWSDVGSFDSLYNTSKKDALGNAIRSTEVLSVDAKNNLVMGGGRMISMVDVEDLVVVDTPDALLISKRGSTQKVREIVSQLKLRSSTLPKNHAMEERPWGRFMVLEEGPCFKVKKIEVFPGMRLSLQKHRFRNEHWVGVQGEGIVTLGEQEIPISPNERIYIPQGEVHRVKNSGDQDLVFIEVQYGEYTGEDDIIRLQDDFARVAEAHV
jgi:mannose-1-phosphate guanylyltransferase